MLLFPLAQRPYTSRVNSFCPDLHPTSLAEVMGNGLVSSCLGKGRGGSLSGDCSGLLGSPFFITSSASSPLVYHCCLASSISWRSYHQKLVNIIILTEYLKPRSQQSQLIKRLICINQEIKHFMLAPPLFT